MPRFFLEEIPTDTDTLYGEDARHISRSLRMQSGEEVTLCDSRGYDYRCALTEVGPEIVRVRVLEKKPSVSEVPCRIRLYQALPKGEKLEFVVQKATELGAAEIVPVITARCISRPHEKSMDKKRQRLQRIAYEAAKQAGRGMVPQVLPMVQFSEAIESMAAEELSILFYEESDTPLRQVLPPRPAAISLMVGSEGGFSAKEAEQARDVGVHIASLGRRILRCETAPLCALSAILYHLGEF